MKTILLAALLSAAALPALAQGLQLAPAQEDVVARVNGEDITRDDVMEELSGMAEQLQGMQPQQMLKAATDRAIESRLLDGAVAKSDVKTTEAYKTQLADLQERLARQVYLQNWVKEKMTDAALKKAYDEAYPGGKGEKQVHARHILVQTKAEAEKVVADLGKGEKFEKIANERTLDPSGKTSGGDLGFFGPGQMVPSFDKAAFALKPGEVSAPVESQFGWHVIRVDEQRVEPAPSFEQAKPELRQRLGQKLMGEMFADLKKDAKIEYVMPATAAPKK